ncbi:MAG TPA: transcription antitermination factor NusB [Ferrovibrio sp.]|uniref:transcription antitermination factor NusB n=1 Tax=Ferrovibrio sp. TaxID=1917215 RepID=UPI002B4B3161|nr:transcription antitermination factor NusB [Ferrovibrio sp.]HLT79233.1 transcription antitermination factor NusB [Ferrovibrio sp.]
MCCDDRTQTAVFGMSEGGQRRSNRSLRPAGRRSVARLFAVQALYEIEFGGTAAEAVIADFRANRQNEEIEGVQMREADADWFAEIVRGVAKRQPELDELIRAAMPRADALERMEAILRYALRCAAYELVARIDVPAATIIDEYLGIVRAFFSSREIKFANGVIDAVARRQRPGEFPSPSNG